MSERYSAKVVKVVDRHTVVINAGSDRDVKVGRLYLIVGLGEEITDPETSESLGRLEVVRGRARVTHVQPRMATLASADVEKPPDVKEITKVSTGTRSPISSIFGPQETITESVKPAEPRPKPFAGVEVGDLVIEA
jgi:hypothetical protein